MSHRPIRSIIEGRKLITAESHFTVSHAARLMREHKIGALVVCEQGRLAGVFTILVRPTTHREPWITHIKRPLERWVLQRLGNSKSQANAQEPAKHGLGQKPLGLPQRSDHHQPNSGKSDAEAPGLL